MNDFHTAMSSGNRNQSKARSEPENLARTQSHGEELRSSSKILQNDKLDVKERMERGLLKAWPVGNARRERA